MHESCHAVLVAEKLLNLNATNILAVFFFCNHFFFYLGKNKGVDIYLVGNMHCK